MSRPAKTERPALPEREFLIGLGSNFAAERWLEFAVRELGAHFEVHCSSPAWSRAIATPGSPQLPAATYLNAALVLRCDWPTWRLQRLLKSIELASGRSPAFKAAGLVPLDLDLLARRLGRHWRTYPRRHKDLQADYLQVHLRELGVLPLN